MELYTGSQVETDKLNFIYVARNTIHKTLLCFNFQIFPDLLLTPLSILILFMMTMQASIASQAGVMMTEVMFIPVIGLGNIQ